MITADIQGLQPGDEVVLYELDFSMLGGNVMRIHPYDMDGPIVWKGESYEPWAVKSGGYGKVGNGQQPRPTISVGNIGFDASGNPIAGVITALCLKFDDLVGAKVTRRRTFAHYLDAVNFPEGNPSASPDEEFIPEVWTIECKIHEEAAFLDFELSSPLEFDDVILPRGKITAVCRWLQTGGYRGPYCGYTGTAMFDLEGNPTSDPTKDKCSGLVKACKLRFGEFGELSHGGHPGADAVRGY